MEKECGPWSKHWTVTHLFTSTYGSRDMTALVLSVSAVSAGCRVI